MKPIITNQRAMDIHKVSDLIEVAGSTGKMAKWCIDGESFTWVKGSCRLVTDTGSELLTGNTKSHAKRKLFELISP